MFLFYFHNFTDIDIFPNNSLGFEEYLVLLIFIDARAQQ